MIRGALLLALTFVPGMLHAGAKLSLADCVQTALKNQPAIKAAAANINAAAGREVQAVSSYFPQLTGSTGIQRKSSNRVGPSATASEKATRRHFS